MADPPQSGTEPISGVKGEGTVDQPYDQGNVAEQAAGPGIEPPSGQTGEGTIEKPYDQGNQPEQLERISTPNAPAQPSADDPLASPSTTHQGSGNPEVKPTKEQEQIIHETRGRDETAQRATATLEPEAQRSTGTAARGGNFDAARSGAGAEANRLRYEDRDVSPGELRDGSHARTGGERGEAYTPGKINKIKDKFHLGRH